MSYAHIKDWLELYTGLERDALHVHGALFLYILAMALFRRSRRSRIPWFFVLGLEVGNELYDLQHNWGENRAVLLAASGKDLWNTMLWPTVLLFVGRYTTWFQRRPRPQVGAPEEG